MQKISSKTMAIYAVSAIALGATSPNYAFAQNNDETIQIEKGETLVVRGQISYRDRSKAIVPTLEYGQEYFQSFEPLTVGDALKRVPSITFLSASIPPKISLKHSKAVVLPDPESPDKLTFLLLPKSTSKGFSSLYKPPLATLNSCNFIVSGV